MRRALAVAFVGALVTACASQDRKSAMPTPSTVQTAAPAGYAQQPYPSTATTTPQPGTPAQEPPAAPPQSRAIQLQGAGRDFDSSERQLDVAAGDCSNACRALGSMDRAAGTLCQLAREGDEVKRCEDAKKKVYSARDRVKTTCGGCPGGPSVERTDPIPSR
jgi:hypothetical protein